MTSESSLPVSQRCGKTTGCPQHDRHAGPCGDSPGDLNSGERYSSEPPVDFSRAHAAMSAMQGEDMADLAERGDRRFHELGTDPVDGVDFDESHRAMEYLQSNLPDRTTCECDDGSGICPCPGCGKNRAVRQSPLSSHADGRRYWRFLPCGECDDPECCEGEGVDATPEVAALTAERDALRATLSEAERSRNTWMERCDALEAERDEARKLATAMFSRQAPSEHTTNLWNTVGRKTMEWQTNGN